MGHAGSPFDNSLPPRHHAHSANARTLLLAHWYERLHPVVASPMREVSSTETSRLTAHWPIITMSLPEGPGIAVSVDCFGPLPVTSRGNAYILVFNDRFSRRADMFALTAAEFTEFTAEGTANILINRCIPLWGCPRSILWADGLQFCSKAFAYRLQASWRSENCHQLLPPKCRWRGGACEPYHGPKCWQ